MPQERLFRLSPVGLTVNCQYVPGDGWLLIRRMRRADEAWSDTELVSYSHMSTAELLDTIAADLEATLDS